MAKVSAQFAAGAGLVALMSSPAAPAAEPDARISSRGTSSLTLLTRFDNRPQPISVTELSLDKKQYHVGKVALNATAEEIWQILTDYENAPRHFSYLKKCTKIQDRGDSHVLSMVSRTGIGPLTVGYVVEVKPTKNRMLEWKRLSGSFKQYEGYWKLEPLDGGRRTLVTYAKHVQGGVLMPEGIVQRAVRDSIPKVLSDLQVTVESTTNKPPRASLVAADG